MGSQFWWFYDVAAAAVILVAVFINARRSVSKAAASLMAFVLGLFVAVAASGSIAGSIYKNTVKSSNTDKIEKALEDESITQKTKSYIESLGYNVVVKEENLEKIFKENSSDSSYGDVYGDLYSYVNNINGRVVDTEEAFKEKMTEGFAGIVSDIVSVNLNRYAAETAAETVADDPDSMSELLALTQEEYMKSAAEYIEENYISSAYTTIIKLLSFVILAIVIIIAVKLFAHAIFESGSGYSELSIGEHICGAIIGIIIGIAAVVLAAVIIRTYAVFGSGEMLFFNDEVIDRTLFFKYVYKLVVKL